MAQAQSTIDIERSADDILEIILDVESYRSIDPRLKTIRWVRRSPSCTVFRFRPNLMGLPAPLSTQMVTRTGDRVDIRPLPSLNDYLVDFTGFLSCDEQNGVTSVTRGLAFRFNPVVGWALDRRLEAWLADDVASELRRLKELMESEERNRTSHAR